MGLNSKKELRNKAIKYLINFGSTEREKHLISEKLKNICGKTVQGNVPDELWQKKD